LHPKWPGSASGKGIIDTKIENMDYNALLTVFLMFITGLGTWFIKAKYESLQLEREKARVKQLEVYFKLVEPYITNISSTSSQEEKENALRKVGSREYTMSLFEFLMFGSDATIRSFYKFRVSRINRTQEISETEKIKKVGLFAKVLKQIRKDLYGKSSEIEGSEILSFFAKDVEQYKDLIDK